MATNLLNEMRIVMVGKTGVGKSELGNSLLGQKHFKSQGFAGSVTSKCKFGTRKLSHGMKLVVVDTPGIFDTRKSNKDTSMEIVRCFGLSSPGPHIFFFVLRIGRYTQEERDTIVNLKNIFGEQVMKFVIVIFTGKDTLEHSDNTLDEYIGSDENLQTLLIECKGRCKAINNWADKKHLSMDVDAIMDLVQCTIAVNGGNHYTGEMYAVAEKALKERLEQLEAEKNKEKLALERRKQEIEEENKAQKQRLEKEMKMKRAQLEKEQKERERKAREDHEKKQRELVTEAERLHQLRIEDDRKAKLQQDILLQEKEKLEEEKEAERRRSEQKRREMAQEQERLRKEEERRRIEQEEVEEKKRLEEEERAQLEEERQERLREFEERRQEQERILKEEEKKWEEMKDSRERLRQELENNDGVLNKIKNFFVSGWKRFVSLFGY
ncbi:GTPase IMAP family member 9 isoform X2 [Patella vulgata]|uniref:GTPase IMAP family member 9 isoform X2 n=1 Tax=Patella vulgata TaxID=6465 RepID=UPI00217F6420|nr:GTPase IMAP family member 9 isoform X2 [Patella vulgata]